MQNPEATAPHHARACRDPRHPSAPRNADDAACSRKPVPDQDDSADARPYPALGVCTIIPVATALVITCAVSPAITFVVLRSKGYSLITASLGVTTGALGLLLAIAVPSHKLT